MDTLSIKEEPKIIEPGKKWSKGLKKKKNLQPNQPPEKAFEMDQKFIWLKDQEENKNKKKPKGLLFCRLMIMKKQRKEEHTKERLVLFILRSLPKTSQGKILMRNWMPSLFSSPAVRCRLLLFFSQSSCISELIRKVYLWNRLMYHSNWFALFEVSHQWIEQIHCQCEKSKTREKETFTKKL